MDSSCSNSNDELPLVTETLHFDETTYVSFIRKTQKGGRQIIPRCSTIVTVVPVMVDGQTVTLTELEESDPLSDTLLTDPISPTIITFEDGSQATLVPNSITTGYRIITLDGKEEIIVPEDIEEETVNYTINVSEESLPVYEALQMEDGTFAYIHSKPEDGTQYLELEDGTLAYITMDESDPEPSVKKPKTFLCSQEGCGRLYASAHHLKVHERIHTGSRPYQCTENGCNKAFSREYSRKAHVRTHTGEKPYKCPEGECGKGFKTSGDLQKHIRTHTGERPFMCPVEGCNRSFTTSNIRKVHIRTHTGERPYVCSSCDKSFASATNYKNHIRIHSGEKPYACTVEGCYRRFTEYSSLYKHHMVHSQEKPYQCGICGRSYRQASTLTVHKRTSHGIIETDDGTEIVLGDVFAKKVLNNTNPTLIANYKNMKSVNTVSSKLLTEGDYIGVLDSMSPEQVFIVPEDDIPEHLSALQHIIEPEDEELQAALDPLQESL